MRLQLLLQPFEQGEGVSGRASETANDAAVLPQSPDLLRIGLNDRVTERHLAVAGDDGSAALLHPEDGGAVILLQGALPLRFREDVGKRSGACKSTLPLNALYLPPRPCRRVAEIAGAEECIELLRQAAQVGGHAVADAERHLRIGC